MRIPQEKIDSLKNYPIEFKIQKLRLWSGLTQKQLAQVLGTSNVIVSNWETGKSIPSQQSLELIREFFGLSLDFFIADEIKLAKSKSLKFKKNKEES